MLDLPTNIVATGSSTVLIGGLPAARISDKTFRASEVSTGMPNVLIGGPVVVFPIGYFVRPPGATERFEQQLGEKVVLFRNPPGAQARHEKLAVGPFDIEVPVCAR